jgi:hypothetical protein
MDTHHKLTKRSDIYHSLCQVSLIRTEPALVKIGKPVLVFPVTRPPAIQLPKMSILHRAEQGVGSSHIRMFPRTQ